MSDIQNIKDEELKNVTGGGTTIGDMYFKYDIGDKFMQSTNHGIFYIEILDFMTNYSLPHYDIKVTDPDGNVYEGPKAESILEGYTKIN